ncbi:MAG: PASTA domain-containing protein, partial [Actinomycetota bacterium]|nr:PASTA domain-containing protein [Actinomycetota bacterium]
PEVAEGQPATARSDVYGLGLVLVEALTGNVPFSTDSAAATLRARVGRILPVTADLGPLGRVLEQAARPEVDQRASAVELGMEFVNVARRLPRPEPLPLVLSIDPGAATAPPQEPEEAVEPEPTPQTDPSPDGAPPHSVGLPQPVDEMPSEPSSGEPILAAHDGFSDAGFEAYQGVVSPEEPVTRRPRWVSPVVAVVVVAVGVLGARAFLTTPVHEVPVLTGIAEAEAANIVTPFEWEVTVVSERSDVQPVVGAVIRTSPVAGDELREGGAFTIVISEGPVLRELPEVIALPGADALDILDSAGFQPFTENVYNEVIEVGEVISWEVPDDPAVVAGDLVEPGTLVRLVISVGPAPREVPNIVGLVVGVARAQLVGTEIRLVEIEEVYDEESEAGLVLSQSPQPGEFVERGGAIEVSVSLGPDLIAFPSVPSELTFEEAQKLLSDAGFTVELTLGAADGTVDEITIEGEEPSAGDEFPNGTQVDVVAT